MTSAVCAWAIIGLIFYVGIMLEREKWLWPTDAFQIIPCLLMVVALWPAGLITFEIGWRTKPWVRKRWMAGQR